MVRRTAARVMLPGAAGAAVDAAGAVEEAMLPGPLDKGGRRAREGGQAVDWGALQHFLSQHSRPTKQRGHLSPRRGGGDRGDGRSEGTAHEHRRGRIRCGGVDCGSRARSRGMRVANDAASSGCPRA